MGKLYLSDTLNLILSDDYNVEDSDIKRLSSTFYNLGISDNNELYGILFMIYSIAKSDITLPVSVGIFRDIWDSSGGVSLDFVSTLANFVKGGFIKLSKQKLDGGLSGNITGDESLESIIVFVNGTDLLNSCVQVFKDFIKSKEVSIQEGVGVNEVPSFVKTYIKRLYDVLDDLSVYVELESFSDEDSVRRVNLNINNTSKYDISDSAIEKLAKSFIKNGERRVVDVECYKDSSRILFLGIDFRKDTKDFNFSCADIFNFIEDLEVNHVR